MKKFLVVVLISLSCIFFVLAQDYAVQHVENNMVLPDGVTASVAFFKNWGDAGKYVHECQPKNLEPMIGVTARTEYELGYFRKTYREDENAFVYALCSIHRETGSKFSVAWVEYDDRVTRCVFTYKGKKLVFDRVDFFDESSMDYADYVAKKKRKQEWINDIVTSIGSIFFPASKPLSPEEFKTALYRARHTSHRMHTGNDSLRSVYVYYIYSDDGYCYSINNPHLVIDENGRFRINNFSNCELVSSVDVLEEVKEAAKKSLYY